MREVLLRCRALEKIYRTDRGLVHAVRGIDLDLEAGRYVAMIGRSGSGKSSLLAMIGGLSRPSAGHVAIDGKDLWSMEEGAMARMRNRCIGHVLQVASLLPTLRAIDNVALPILLDRRADRRDAYDRAARRMREVGLESHLDAYPAEMSAGEQRRTVIARALVNDPVLLLADEPTSDLDEQTEREIMALMLGFHRDRKIALLLVTHHLALASEAEQVIHIADGLLTS